MGGLQRGMKVEKAYLEEDVPDIQVNDAEQVSETFSGSSLLGLQRRMKVEKVAMKLSEDDDETSVPPNGDASTLGLQRATRLDKRILLEDDDVAGPQNVSGIDLPSETENNIGGSILGLQRSTQRRKVVISESD